MMKKSGKNWIDMQIILTEEEYNKIKLDEKSIYDKAYKDAYDSIYEEQSRYFKELSDIIKNNLSYGLGNSMIEIEIKNLTTKTQAVS